MNILKRAHDIVYERSEEASRQYGDFHQSMQRMADIASLLGYKKFSVSDAYVMMIALKLSRQAYKHKEDNLLDALAYMASWNDYLNEDTTLHSEIKPIDLENLEMVINGLKSNSSIPTGYWQILGNILKKIQKKV